MNERQSPPTSQSNNSCRHQLTVYPAVYVDTWRLVFVLVVERFIAMHARWSSEELGSLAGQLF
jgi:hypothetical protein